MAGLLAVFAEFEARFCASESAPIWRIPGETGKRLGGPVNARIARGSDPQTAPLWTQQVGHRTPPAHRPHFGALYSDSPRAEINLLLSLAENSHSNMLRVQFVKGKRGGKQRCSAGPTDSGHR